jgi:hypothetical protein
VLVVEVGVLVVEVLVVEVLVVEVLVEEVGVLVVEVLVVLGVGRPVLPGITRMLPVVLLVGKEVESVEPLVEARTVAWAYNHPT